MSQTLILLNERAVLLVGGPEAAPFLQGLVTADISKLEDGGATHAGLLTPQGKILFDFFIVRQGGGFFIDCAASQKQGLMQRLAMYRLRADVEIAGRDDLAVAAGIGRDKPEMDGAIIYPDPRLAQMGWRVIGDAKELAKAAGGAVQAYHEKRIALGLPDSDSDIGSGEVFPHEADFDQLGGVSFTKGCYVGQEVVSRMQHRGTARARIVPVIFDAGTPASGDEIRAEGKKIGHILSVAGLKGLALVRLDRAQKALNSGHALTAAKTGVHLVKPDWAGFDVPVEGK